MGKSTGFGSKSTQGGKYLFYTVWVVLKLYVLQVYDILNTKQGSTLDEYSQSVFHNQV